MMKFIASTLTAGSALGFAAVMALSASGPAFADTAKVDKMMPDSGVKLMAELKGANEVPGPGSENGSGMFTGRLNPESGQLCYEAHVDDLGDITAAHVHKGAKGVAGGVVVALGKFDDGKSSGCVSMDAGAAKAIIADPSAYYVNVHDKEHPKGAIRGQLMK